VDVLLLKTRTCPLCDDALLSLRRQGPALSLLLRVEDITDSPALMDAYGHQVPVVFVGGIKRFFGRVERGLLLREVEAARERTPN